jgi:thioredoxin reductase (NADPH)
LYLARFRRRVTILDAGTSRARLVPCIRTLPPFPEGIAGADLLARMRDHALSAGARLLPERVEEVEPIPGGFRVHADAGTRQARSVILATGVVNHPPPVPPDLHDRAVLRGLIRYCPICDGFEAQGKHLAVLGDGPHAAAEARFLQPFSASVTLLALPGCAGEGRIVTGIDLSGDCVTLALAEGAPRRFDSLYVALGTRASSALAARLGLKLGADACIPADTHQRTGLPLLYAAGDVTEGLDQIAVAMGQGAQAATSLHNDLRAPGAAEGTEA